MTSSITKYSIINKIQSEETIKLVDADANDNENKYKIKR